MFKKLKLWQKLFFVSLLWSLSICILSYMFYQENMDQITFVDQELLGVEYIGTLGSLNKNMQQHRGMMAGLLGGDKRFEPRVEEKKKDIQEDLKAIEELEKTIGPALTFTEQSRELRRRTEHIINIARTMGAKKSFDEHTRVNEDIVKAITIIADSSNLILEP